MRNAHQSFEKHLTKVEDAFKFDSSFLEVYEDIHLKMYEEMRKKYIQDKKTKYLDILCFVTLSHVMWKFIHTDNEKLKGFIPSFYASQSDPSLKDLKNWINLAKDETKKNVLN